MAPSSGRAHRASAAMPLRRFAACPLQQGLCLRYEAAQSRESPPGPRDGDHLSKLADECVVEAHRKRHLEVVLLAFAR